MSADFQFAFRVIDEITIKKFPNLPRHGARSRQPNERFLNAELFDHAFISSCEPFRKNIGLLIFEFSRFYPSDYEHGRDFVADLDKFLAALPKGWPYAVRFPSGFPSSTVGMPCPPPASRWLCRAVGRTLR